MLLNDLSPHNKERSGGGLPATEVVRLSHRSFSGKGGDPSSLAAVRDAGRGGNDCKLTAEHDTIVLSAEGVEFNFDSDFWASDNMGDDVDIVAEGINVPLALDKTVVLASSGTEMSN